MASKEGSEQIKHDLSVRNLCSKLDDSGNFESITPFFKYRDANNVKREIDIIAKRGNVVYAIEVKNGLRLPSAIRQLSAFENCPARKEYGVEIRKFFYTSQKEGILTEIKEHEREDITLDEILR